MPAYETDEARLEVPERWIDRSVNSLEYTRPEGVVRVIVQRKPRGASALAELSRDRVIEMRRRLAGFELLREEDVLVAGRPAADVAVRYQDHEEHLYQRTISLLVGAKLVTVGVIAPVSLIAQADQMLQQVRATLVIRRDAETP
ncbi:MAG TPA: DcrB-related protein [Candidatus Nanopelagicales bacterium]|nr:DcrB-related protein [Candidatus Nanopelagicales bacterium]